LHSSRHVFIDHRGIGSGGIGGVGIGGGIGGVGIGGGIGGVGIGGVGIGGGIGGVGINGGGIGGVGIGGVGIGGGIGGVGIGGVGIGGVEIGGVGIGGVGIGVGIGGVGIGGTSGARKGNSRLGGVRSSLSSNLSFSCSSKALTVSSRTSRITSWRSSGCWLTKFSCSDPSPKPKASELFR
jgi:hypothetical protein